MQKIDKKYLVGLAIGDGYINRKGNSCRLCITHSEKQLSYLEAKAKKLEKIFGCKIYIMPFNNNGYKAYRIQVSHDYFRVVHKWLYKNGKKTITLPLLNKLSNEAVAYWYMDDGSLIAKKRNGKIHAFEIVISMYVPENEANAAITFFKDRFGVDFTLKRNKGKFSIRCGTQNAKKLLNQIDEFKCSGMEYKFF